VIEQWLVTAADATAAFPLWLLVLSSNPAERASDEARLAKLIESKDPVARLRAAFALGRLDAVSTDTITRCSRQDAAEPADSPARVYVLSAVFLHGPRASTATAGLKRRLFAFLDTGQPNEQFEAATVIGMRGSLDDVPALSALLKNSAADARIGAANAMLQVLR
jgi:HEAT repeat protein